MNGLPPWARGPFEIILHAELHYRNGQDFDRRIAAVGYDNAIEVAIHTYLNLNPLQRGNKQYKRDDVEKWLSNFHTKIEFLEAEVTARKAPMECDRATLIWYHDVRNTQYHVGGPTIPQVRDLEEVRDAALWVFGLLFNVSDVVSLLDQEIASQVNTDLPVRSDMDDRLIDNEYGIVEVAGQLFYASEVVYALDPVLYSEIVNDIKTRDVTGEIMNLRIAK